MAAERLPGIATMHQRGAECVCRHERDVVGPGRLHTRPSWPNVNNKSRRLKAHCTRQHTVAFSAPLAHKRRTGSTGGTHCRTSRYVTSSRMRATRNGPSSRVHRQNIRRS